MLPTSEIVFLDEVFKSNSAILNSLLMLLNERTYNNGSQRLNVPLLSVFGASNEVPNDESLTAIFDRFLLRVQSNNLDSYHFNELLLRGLKNEQLRIRGLEKTIQPVLDSSKLHALHQQFDQYLRFTDQFLTQYKGLVFQIRSEGISFSDRRAVKMLKLFAASAFVDGRQTPDTSDFFILKHVWNSLDQTELLDEIVGPILEAHYREHPESRRFAATEAGLGGSAELQAGPDPAETWLALERAFDARKAEFAAGEVLATALSEDTPIARRVKESTDEVFDDGALGLVPECTFCDLDGLCGKAFAEAIL